MRERMIGIVLALALITPALVGLTESSAAASTFSNSGSITLNDPATGSPGCTNPSVVCNAPATPYPSTIAVSGLTGTVNNVTVTLNDASYAFSQDIDALLVGPTGASLVVVANMGPDGAPSEGNPALSNSTTTFSDAGTEPVATTPWGTGNTFKPANFSGFNEVWEPPAPSPPYGNPGPDTGIGPAGASFASQFDGTNPNGTWSLYVITNSAGDGTGAIAGGWTLNVTTAAAAAPTTTSLASAPNPSFTSGTGSSVTLTATVSSTSTVGAGTVDFTDGGVTISGCGAQPVGSGQATCSTTFTTEGNHALEAVYGGTASFGESTGSLTQQVNDHTTVTGSSYCNTGSITLNNPPDTLADASPYPSRVFVSSLSGDVSHLTVTLNGVTYSESQDIDALLVGPAGQSMILVADAGPNTSGAISNVTLTLDDNAASTLAQSAIWGAPNSSVTSKAVNYGGVNETFGPPAPAGPYANPGPAGGGTATLGEVYNGTNPNGTWSLYVITTGAGDGTGSVGGGWCVNVSTATVTPTTTAISSNNNPSFTTAPGNSVTFTATVSSTSTVSEGTVDFTSNGVTIPGCAAQAVSAGTATCTTNFTAEGSDTIEALYSGDATFGASNASLTQAVNDHTTITGNSFCNTGSITLNNPNINNPEIDATPYPSNIFVAGRPGNLLHLSVTLNAVTYSESQDIDALLVGPTGQSLILVAAAGPNSSGALSNVTLTLDDNAATTLSSTAAWGAPNSTVVSKPVNYGGDNEVWGPPAPGAPYGNPGPSGGGTATLGGTFDGSSPNGTWSLYLITTAAGDGTGAVAGGWCLGVTSPAPPTLTKSFGASSIPLNGSTSLSFTVTNPNASTTVGGIGFSDTLPSGLVLGTPTGEMGSCGGGSITAAGGGSSVSLSGATLAGGATCTFSVNVVGTAAGSLVNTTSPVSSSVGAGAAATATLVVVAPPSLNKSFGASSVALNGSIALSFTASNPNTATSLTGVGFTDTLPSGLVVATPNGEAGSCGGGTITANAGSSSVNLSGATLAAGASCTFSVNVTGVAVGSQVNTTSTISSNEGGSGAAATATLMVTPIAPQITKSFGAASIALNGSTTLSFTIGNPVNDGTSTGIGFVDTLPSGLVVSTPNGVTGTCGGGTITATAASGTVSLSGANLAEGASCTFSVGVTGTTAGVKNNSVTVSSTTGGTGNTATASITVVAPPTLSKSFGAAMVALNGSTSLTFTVSNPNSTSSLSGIGFTDTFPSGLVVATPNGETGTCGGGTITATAGSGSASLAGATLAAGANCTFAVNVTGTAAGNKVNTTSTVSSNEGGTGAAATATLMVAAGPPQITKSFGAATIPVGGATSLSFTITNPTANGASTGIAFSDNLPAGLNVSTPNAVAGGCGGGTITATGGSSAVSLSGATLAAGASCTFSVSVTGIAAGVQNNSVTVTSTNGGTGNTATASVTVVAPPTLSKSFGAASVPLGGSTGLSFTVANPNSTVSLSGVGFTDALPAGLVVSTPNGVTGACGTGTITAVAGSGTIGLSGATLAASTTCTFSVNVTGTAAGSKVNTTSAPTSTNGGTGTAATATLVVVAPPVIAKSFGAANIALNGSTSLTFTLTNPAANTAPETGVAFTDTFPAGMVVATPSGGASDCADADIIAVPGSNQVTAMGILIPVGGSCTITLNVVGTTSGALTNSVTISSTDGGTGNTAMATLDVALPPQISKGFGAATIPLNGSTSLSFTVTNPNASFSLSGVAFTDSLPAGLIVSTPSGESGTCGGGTITATAGATSVSLAGATLAGSGSCTFSVNVTGTTAGVKSNSVAVSSTNAGAGNTATATVTVVAPPTITKAFGTTSIPVGGSTSLTFTLANPNSTVSITGVGFTDGFPAGLVVSTPDGLTGSCGGGTITAVAGGTSVSLSAATLAAAASCTFSVNVTGTAAGSKLNMTSAPTSTNGGSGTAATATLAVVAPPVIAKSFGATNIALNGSTTLTFTITNPAANTVALSGVAFTDTLPAGLVVTSPNGLTGTCGGGTITATAGSGSVSLTGASVATSGSCTFSVSVTGTASGTKTNSVTVTSTNGGTGNTATATLLVALPPTIAKSFGAATIPVGGSTSLSITVTNPNASFSLTGVAFTDSLPAGLVVATPNGLTGSCGGGTVTATAGSGSVSLSGATLAGGATCTLSVKVTGTTSGVLVNSVTVTSTNAGTGDTAMASITVVAPPRIAKAFGAASIPFGGSTSLTFTLINPNSTVSITGVGFTDTLPSGLIVASPDGVSGSCGGGTITATAGSTSISLSGATIAASGSCTFSVNVTAKAVGAQVNTTSAVTSTNGGTGLTASATLMVTQAPTTTTVVASPTSPLFGSPVTFTATVVPSGPNGSGINPTGTVSFYLNGGATPVAVVPLSAAGTAAFTTSGLGAGSNTVTASYSGDTNFLPSSSTTSAMVTVTCTTTITGKHVGIVLAAGSTCIVGATVTGAIVVPNGASLDIENSTLLASINVFATAGFRMCGSTSAAVAVTGATGFVVIGDAKDGCAPNTIGAALTLIDNTGGVQAIGNTVSGAVVATGNSGAGPFPDDTAPNISDN